MAKVILEPIGEPREQLLTPDAWRGKEGFEQDDLLFVTVGRPDAQKNHPLA